MTSSERKREIWSHSHGDTTLDLELWNVWVAALQMATKGWLLKAAEVISLVGKLFHRLLELCPVPFTAPLKEEIEVHIRPSVNRYRSPTEDR